MYLVRVTPPMNLTFSDDSLFLKKKVLGGGYKFSEIVCLLYNATIAEENHQKPTSLTPKLSAIFFFFTVSAGGIFDIFALRQL